MIKKEDIEKIRKSIDLVKFLNDRGIEVIERGSTAKALCPIHSERSPSFNVRTEWGYVHCFGCGFSGDIFALVQEMDGLSFHGAILELASYADIKIEEEEDEEYSKLKRLYSLTELASQWFRENFVSLPSEHPAKNNFAERELLETANEDVNIGFSPNMGLIQHLQKNGYNNKEIQDVGLINEDGNQLFRKRIVWSIRNIQGRVVGFTARKVYETDNGPKYINSPQTQLYNKSATLFGLYEAHKHIVKSQEVNIVEGQMDVMALRAAGVLNVVAPCGTAFGKNHSYILQRLSDRGKDSKHFSLKFCFDGDQAGIKAARRVYEEDPTLQLFSQVVLLPENEDPCDIRLRLGNEGLLKILSESVTLTEFILKQELKQWDITSAEGKVKFLKEANSILDNITDEGMLEIYRRKISWWLGIPISDLNEKFTQKSLNKKQIIKETSTLISMGELRKRVLSAMIQYPSFALYALNKYNVTEDVFQNEGKTIFCEAYKLLGTKERLDVSDFSHPELASTLLFMNLGSDESANVNVNKSTPEERAEKIVNNIIKVFISAHNLEENSKIQSRINGAFNGDGLNEDENLLSEILEAREHLNIKKRRLGVKRKIS